jgi:predicted amidophosphoribosyltransferase
VTGDGHRCSPPSSPATSTPIPTTSVASNLIVASPTFADARRHRVDHTQLMLDHAEQMCPSWPWARGIVRKSAPTPQLAGLRFRDRALAAEGPLRRALEVIDRDRVAGRRVLVYDDVFTTGLTLREVALKLRAAGAIEVGGLALARRPYVARPAERA